MSESNGTHNVGPGEYLTALLSSDLSNIEKVYLVFVASCADSNGRVLIDDDGMPIPLNEVTE